MKQLALLLFLTGSSLATDRPSANEIFAAAIGRARTVADNTNAPVYLYDKRTTIDTLDSEGKRIKRKVKLFLVTMTGGVPQEKLIGLEGEKLSAKEIAKEQEKSSRWRRKFIDQKDASTKRTFVPADLTKKFRLDYLRSEKRSSRQTHVIGFRPHPKGPQPKGFSDRIINQLSGTLWIDAADSEITRIEVKLGQKVNLWGGLLASLYGFEFRLDRKRSPTGVWFNHVSDISLDARGLFKRLRMKINERSSNLRPAR